ncbi:hypothetical protein SAMD00019534_073350, partial [Acytostelium subglobosum LB1]|uniref:hypothetical protein n=1 Tax=Acytostelium subglobosum LB1 TaxID=1410327 RepID=UPI00064502D1
MMMLRRSLLIGGGRTPAQLYQGAITSIHISGRARASKIPDYLKKDDDFADDDQGEPETTISKASMDKIKQRFTAAFKRPDITKQAPPTEEEEALRLSMYHYEQYRQKLLDKKDAEEKQKLHYQWEAVAELPEDLRKTAMLVDTHDDAPDWIPFWTTTPPSKDPQSKIVYKKKEKPKKRSEELLTGNLF